MEKLFVTVSEQRQQDDLRLFVAGFNKQWSMAIIFRIAGEFLEVSRVAFYQSMNPLTIAGVIDKRQFRVEHLRWTISKSLCEAMARAFAVRLPRPKDAEFHHAMIRVVLELRTVIENQTAAIF